MKLILTACCLYLLAITANAQLTLTPRLGLETSKTNAFFNGNSFGTESNVNIKAAIKLDYNIRNIGGPYLSVGTTAAPEMFSFADLSKGVSQFTTASTGQQLSLEAGYQFTTKAFALNNSTARTVSHERRSHGSACIRSFGCGANKMARSSNVNLRLQPSLGIAYNPSSEDALVSKGNGSQFNAGWTTAIVPAIGFLFSNGTHKMAVVTLSYTKGLQNANSPVTGSESGKSTVNNLSSATSAWALTAGIPISFSRSTTSRSKSNCRSHCNSTKHSCSRGQMN